MLLVHHPRRSDRDFRQALSITEDQTFGRIQAAKFVSWSYGHPPRGVTRGVGPLPPDANDEIQATKMRFVAHALDQLVSLINDQPRCVVATGDSSALDAVDLHSGQSLSLRITFEQGCHAEIDIRLDSPTQFQSGWLLTAERGGYANGRRFTLTDEGEVFDSPMTEIGHGQEADQFDWLAQQIQTGQPDPAEELRLRSVAALLHAAQRSLESRQVTTL